RSVSPPPSRRQRASPRASAQAPAHSPYPDPVRTRLAPSPTGALHVGNARTFLLTWLHARAAGESVVLRIDDLDGPRVKAGREKDAADDLRWLGLDWDEALPVLRQSERTAAYDAACARLVAG